MSFDFDSFVRLSPVISGLLVALVYWVVRLYRNTAHQLDDVFVVGITGSSLPSGVGLIYAAVVDINVITTLSYAPIYIALAGIAVLYLASRTIKDKLNGSPLIQAGRLKAPLDSKVRPQTRHGHPSILYTQSWTSSSNRQRFP